MKIRNVILLCACSLAALVSTPDSASAQTFEEWQQQTAQKARKQGISQHTIKTYLLTTVESDKIITLDRKQPENKLTYMEYLEKAIPQAKIKRGREEYRRHRVLLNKIGKQYGVDPEIIVALWGMETGYGSNTGNIRILDALSTLAYEGRRSELFTTELLTLLTLLDQKQINPKNLKGSWAGAMGQTQFMPSSFAKYAVDYNKDGKKDIWHTDSDVFASIANYLAKNGWQKNAISITPAEIPVRFDPLLADLKITKPVAEWKQLGVEPEDQPKDLQTPATLLALDREGQSHYALVFHNFKVLLGWNYSRLFAGAALHLAQEIKEGI